MAPVAAGSVAGLRESLTDRTFTVGNPNGKLARMTVVSALPEPLRTAGWRVAFQSPGGESFALGSRQTREVVFTLVPGDHAALAALRDLGPEQRTLTISVKADGIVIGGMSYLLDPALEHAPKPGPTHAPRACDAKATELLACLGRDVGRVTRVRVRRISLDLEVDDDEC